LVEKHCSMGKFYNDEPTSIFKPGDFWSSGYRFLFKRHKERVPKRLCRFSPWMVMPSNRLHRAFGSYGLVTQECF
jgi:hypothetical protein